MHESDKKGELSAISIVASSHIDFSNNIVTLPKQFITIIENSPIMQPSVIILC